jgi:hypothetical protein
MITRSFAYRFAAYGFAQIGNRYPNVSVRPVLSSGPTPTPRTTYADVLPHFHPLIVPVRLAGWMFVAYAPGPPEVIPHLTSVPWPIWYNVTEKQIGPFGALAVYSPMMQPLDGPPVPQAELMWVTPLAAPVIIEPLSSMQVAGGLKFRFDSE